MIDGPLPRHAHHMSKIEAASSRSVARDLDDLIRVALKWLALPPGIQRSDPLLIGPYVHGGSVKLLRTLDQVARLHHRAEFAAESSYCDLSEMLRQDKADLWPEGLTKDHIECLKYYSAILSQDACETAPSAFDMGASLTTGESPTRSSENESQTPTTPISPEAPAVSVPEAPSGTPPIVLRGPVDQPIVWGRPKSRLTQGQYQVVKALVEAHPERLSKDQLARRSGTEDPVGMIDRLRKKDKDWRAVLDKPGQAHGGYGIRSSPPTKA